MASLTSRRMPSAKPVWPCSVRSCRTWFKRSGWLGCVRFGCGGWLCLSTSQQETKVARPRLGFRARGAPPAGFGCARLATLAFAPPHPAGEWAEGRKTIYRSSFIPFAPRKCIIPRLNTVQLRGANGITPTIPLRGLMQPYRNSNKPRRCVGWGQRRWRQSSSVRACGKDGFQPLTSGRENRGGWPIWPAAAGQFA